MKKMLPAFAAFLLPMIGLTGTVSQQMRLLQDPGPLSIVHDQGYRDALRYVAANPSRTYVIRASGLAAGWYAYEGRKSRVFIAGSSVADIPIPPGSLPIARIPAQLDNGTFLFADRYLDETVANAKPVVEVHNPQGEDGLGKAKWYWLGDSMRVTVFTMSGPDQAVGILSLTGEAGPANPAPERVLRLTDVTTGTPHELKLQGQARLSVPVLLRRGVNNFVIETVSPKEVVTPIPGDPRKHLVRISQIEVERRDKQAPQGSAATPVIFPDNPQGEDRGPNGSSWYWVGKFMDLKIVWPEGQQGDARYELRFSAEAGPANPDRRRTIRILDLDAKTEEKVELSEPKKVAVGVKRRLGTTNLRVEVAFPAEQIAKIPSDPRNHMLRASEFEIVAIEPTKRRQ